MNPILKIVFALAMFGSSVGCEIEKGGNHDSPLSPGDVSSSGMISFAIDDGWRSTYDNAIPIFDAYRIKTTCYIITGRFNNPSYIGISEILSLQSRGHEIGAHSRSHIDLRGMSPAQLVSEIKGSQEDLYRNGVASVTSFSYPFGSYDQTIVQAVKSAGYTNARTSNGGYNTKGADRFLLNRQNLGNKVDIAQVRAWIETAIKDDVWLILVMHHVDSTDTEFSISPDFLRHIVEIVREKNIKVMTVSQAVTNFI